MNALNISVLLQCCHFLIGLHLPLSHSCGVSAKSRGNWVIVNLELHFQTHLVKIGQKFVKASLIFSPFQRENVIVEDVNTFAARLGCSREKFIFNNKIVQWKIHLRVAINFKKIRPIMHQTYCTSMLYNISLSHLIWSSGSDLVQGVWSD